ncbi:MAG: gamma-glutamyl-gamma-aminobutyrate hydrolase family protein [Pseudomonadota bacterium]|nr:gamma-glutamyl-gamma-aminobutyrate hydrolase family protein [Pseudomonadota bacterium]
MKKPIIGITSDYEKDGGYSKFPWYALRKNYCTAIEAAGGVPIVLSNEIKLIKNYIELIDGLIISGGDFDVNPKFFGEKDLHHSVKLKESRTKFEFEITKKFLKKNQPILGICGGEQLLAVCLGCSLVQHIPDEYKNPLEHEQKNPRNETSHEVSIRPGTKLYKIIKQSVISVNSAHHQSVKDLPEEVAINAIAPDGVIEGIEHQKHKWCVGVQWHPEFTITKSDRLLFSSFIDNCK